MQPLRFIVLGVPAPKGSARAFFVKNLGRAVVTAANAKTRPWEQAIRAEAERARDGAPAATGPVSVRAVFRMPRPKGHFAASGALRSSAPAAHAKKPDADKLVRTLLDALTGVLFVDDGQVTRIDAEKRFVRFGESPGVEVEVEGAGA